jgi:hypothetical protein
MCGRRSACARRSHAECSRAGKPLCALPCASMHWLCGWRPFGSHTKKTLVSGHVENISTGFTHSHHHMHQCQQRLHGHGWPRSLDCHVMLQGSCTPHIQTVTAPSTSMLAILPTAAAETTLHLSLQYEQTCHTSPPPLSARTQPPHLPLPGLTLGACSQLHTAHTQFTNLSQLLPCTTQLRPKGSLALRIHTAAQVYNSSTHAHCVPAQPRHCSAHSCHSRHIHTTRCQSPAFAH